MDAAEEDIETRGKYKIPADAAEASWAELQKYMDATQVQTIFQESLRVLLQRPELPYNPYIGFHNRIKVHQEKFHLSQQTREEIVRNLNNDVENHHIETVHTVKHYSSLWGAKSIITVINPAALEKYRWLVTTVTPGLLADMDQYKTEVMVALTGPAVFTGAFYTDVPSVTIHVEYLVTGPELQQAMYQFVSSLMADIDAMYQSEHHSVLSAEIRHAENEGNKPSKVTWTLQRIGQETEEFMAQVKETVLLYKYVTLKCSFQLDPDDTRYVHGDKIYAFNFMKNADDSLAPQGIECYAEIPAVCVHTGVFFEKSGAENYFSMYEPESINMDLARLPQTDESAKGNQNPSQTSPEPGTSSSHHDNSIKMKIDGFLIPPSDDSVIFSWRITSPIRSYFQQQVAAAFTEVALYKVLYNLIILTLLDRKSLKHSEDVLVEVWRIFHGTYGHLNVLMQRNKALRAAIEAVTLDQDYGDIRPLLIQYMEDIEITLCDSFTERSQDQVNIGRVMVARVQSLLPLAENILASDSHSNFVMEDLHALNLYLVPLMMGTADICLQASDKATMFIREIKETLQQADPEVVQRIKKRPVEKPVKKRRGLFGTTEVPKKPVVTEEQEDEGEYSHGREDSVVCNHRTSVLPVQTLIDKEMSPVKVVYETVLMKYMLDCHFDDMWTGYLLELTCDVSLPRNPFSRLVSSLRQAAMRMDLCYEKPTAVVQKAFNSEQKIKHKNSYMHSIAGLGVFGLETALTLIDTGVITSILQVLQLMQQEVYIQKKGPYRVGICLALCGPCTWYGRVQPYLNKIELQEHYYIQGPSGCHGEAIQLFAELVFNNMEALQSKRKGIGLAVGGVFLGDPLTIHWTLQDMMDKKQEFLSSLAQTCRRKQPIYGKVYMLLDNWFYVTVVEHFKLHFLVESAKVGKQETFYEDDPTELYMMLFGSYERAMFHYQLSGPVNHMDPLSACNVEGPSQYLEDRMYECQTRHDWLQYYRNLLLYDLINKRSSHVCDCWRMLHSVAGEIEYLNSMIDTMKGLVHINLAHVTSLGTSNEALLERQKQEADSPVNQAAFSRMLVAFLQKLEWTLGQGVTLSDTSLFEFLMERKLSRIIEYDEITKKPSIAPEKQSMTQMDDMKGMLRALQDTLAADMKSALGTLPALESTFLRVKGSQLDSTSTLPLVMHKKNRRKASLLLQPVLDKTKLVEVPMYSKYDSPFPDQKSGLQSPITERLSAKTDQLSPKPEQPSPKTDLGSPMLERPSPKPVQPSSKPQNSRPKPEQQSPKLQHSSPKPKQPSLMPLQTSPKP